MMHPPTPPSAVPNGVPVEPIRAPAAPPALQPAHAKAQAPTTSEARRMGDEALTMDATSKVAPARTHVRPRYLKYLAAW